MTPQNALAHVLAFDTCGVVGSVALLDLKQDTGTVTCLLQAELAPKTAAAQLMPAIAAMLQEAGIALTSLHALIVVHGPGSFTGVRVGLSTAKGLAHAIGLPVLAISRLAVLASLAPQPACLALLNAGRGEFYAGRYRDGRCEREWLASLDEVVAAAEAGDALVVAEQAAEQSVAEHVRAWQPALAGPLDASNAARVALGRLRSADWDDLARLDANYLRHSDAELFARPAPVRSE